MKIVLTFMHKDKRYNVAVESAVIPTNKDAFKFRLNVFDPDWRVGNGPYVLLIVNHIDFTLHYVRQIGMYPECTDYSAEINEIIVHCDCYEDK